MSSINATSSAPPPQHTYSSSNKFNPSMAVIIVVLIGAMIVVVALSMYIRKCTRGTNESNNRVSPTGNGNESVRFYDRPGEGLDRALVDALPKVSFSVVKTQKGGKEDLECSVCLEKFAEDETLRLLPKCSHVFHTECIDVWFLSHSTCPLCRTSLKPTFQEIGAGVPEVGEVSRRILVAQEIFGSGRQAPTVDSPLPEDEALEGSSSEVGRLIGRDSERNSARLALFRNSDSFKQAARGVEVRERLATLSARYPTSSVDVEKAHQRASSLSCVNFSLQRTSSSDAAGAGEFYNSEVFKYGSQRYGAPGSSLNTSLGRLGNLNERELQNTGDLSNTNPSAEPKEEEASSSASGEQWTTLDLNGASNAHTPKTPVAVNSDNPDVSTTPDTRRLPGKPRSGPLIGKQVTAAHHKDQRVRTERGSFRGLRGSFSLHRSASEGRAQIFAVEPHPTPTDQTPLDVGGGPRSDATSPTDSNNATFTQRTIQWLSGGSKHSRSISTRASLDQRNELQQIVTE